jgi:hypothetical protein
MDCNMTNIMIHCDQPARACTWDDIAMIDNECEFKYSPMLTRTHLPREYTVICGLWPYNALYDEAKTYVHAFLHMYTAIPKHVRWALLF